MLAAGFLTATFLVLLSLTFAFDAATFFSTLTAGAFLTAFVLATEAAFLLEDFSTFLLVTFLIGAAFLTSTFLGVALVVFAFETVFNSFLGSALTLAFGAGAFLATTFFWFCFYFWSST